MRGNNYSLCTEHCTVANKFNVDMKLLSKVDMNLASKADMKLLSKTDMKLLSKIDLELLSKIDLKLSCLHKDYVSFFTNNG